MRNERFLSAGDGTAFRPAENTRHDNTYPYSQGVDALGGELKGDILKLGEQRVFFARNQPSSGVFQQGDLIFKSDAIPDEPMGWVCTTAGTAGSGGVAMFKTMPKL